MWSGPDTQGNSMLLTSSDAVSAVPPPPRKSNWALRMFSASWNLQVRHARAVLGLAVEKMS